jgi:hypothetical protein
MALPLLPAPSAASPARPSCRRSRPRPPAAPRPTPRRDVATAAIFTGERSFFARKTQRRQSRTHVVRSGKRRWTHAWADRRSPTRAWAECRCPATSPARGGLLDRPQLLPLAYCVTKNQLFPTASSLARSSLTSPPWTDAKLILCQCKTDVMCILCNLKCTLGSCNAKLMACDVLLKWCIFSSVSGAINVHLCYIVSGCCQEQFLSSNWCLTWSFRDGLHLIVLRVWLYIVRYEVSSSSTVSLHFLNSSRTEPGEPADV